MGQSWWTSQAVQPGIARVAYGPAHLDSPLVPDSPALEISGLVKRYGGRAVVDGLDLVARPGEVTAVLGPNGAGKTTTIECCEGLRQADGGTVRVLGRDPWSTPPSSARAWA